MTDAGVFFVAEVNKKTELRSPVVLEIRTPNTVKT